MALVKISELIAAATLTGTEVYPIVQSGSTKKTSPDAPGTYARTPELTDAVVYVTPFGNNTNTGQWIGLGTKGAKLTIPSAIAALPADGGTVVLASGTYSTSVKQDSTKNLILRGAGMGKTILTRSAAVQILDVIGAGVRVVLEDLTLDGATLNAGLMRASQMDRFEAHRVHFKGAGTPGYAAGRGNAYDGIFFSSGNGQVDTAIFRSCIFENIERDGICAFGGLKHLDVDDTNVFTNCGRFAAVSQHEASNTYGPLTVKLRGRAKNCGAGGCSVETHASLPVVDVDIDMTIIDCGNNDWGYGWGLGAGVNTRGNVRGIVRGAGASNVGSYLVSGVDCINNGGPVSIDVEVSGSQQHGVVINRDTGTAYTLTVRGSMRGNGNNGVYANGIQAPQIHVAATLNGKEGVKTELCPGAVIMGEMKDNSQSSTGVYAGVHTKDADHPVVGPVHIVGVSHRYGWENTNCASPSFFGRVQNFSLAWFSDAGGTSHGSVIAGSRTFYGTAVPATGTWAVGDRVFNTGGTAAATPGWRCTVAGTPGTWVALPA